MFNEITESTRDEREREMISNQIHNKCFVAQLIYYIPELTQKNLKIMKTMKDVPSMSFNSCKKIFYFISIFSHAISVIIIHFVQI